MSINFYYFRTFFGYLCMVYILSSCAQSTIPQIYVPEKRGELDASVSLGLGLSGVHTNWIYGLTDNFCLQGAAGISYPFPYYFGDIPCYAEVGMGLKTTSFIQLISFTYGYGQYGAGSLTYGGTYGVYYHFGNFNKYALACIFPFSARAGMTSRMAGVTGKGSGAEGCLICDPYKDLPFTRIYFEPSLYYKMGKHKRFYCDLMGRLPLYSADHPDSDGFGMSYANLTFGWNFRVLKGHANKAKL